jgi:ketosteroid isomerase-like protein
MPVAAKPPAAGRPREAEPKGPPTAAGQKPGAKVAPPAAKNVPEPRPPAAKPSAAPAPPPHAAEPPLATLGAPPARAPGRRVIRFPQRPGAGPPEGGGPGAPGGAFGPILFEGPPPVPTPQLPRETVRREAPKAKEGRPALLEANGEFYAALAARDIGRMAKVWANDGTVRCAQPNGVLLRGWEEVRRGFEQIFSTDRPYKIELTQVYSEESEALGYVSLVEKVEMPQTSRPRREHPATNIFRLEKNAWKMVLHHAT